jgi:N-acylneuraminate cytidylyltransferase
MVKENSDGTYGLVNAPPLTVKRRQDAPIVYYLATVCYVVNSEFIMSHDSIFEGRVGAVHVPIERAIDIDTLLDFQVAEYLLNLEERFE